jgi:hypothetical protein
VVEERVKKCLKVTGQPYVFKDWQPAYDAVLNAEDDTVAALNAVDLFEQASVSARNEADPVHITPPTMATAATMATMATATTAAPAQLVNVENDLSGLIESLVERRGIRGKPLLVEEFINPIEERTALDESPFSYKGGDDDIIAEVIQEHTGPGVTLSEDEDTQADDDSGDLPTTTISFKQGIRNCVELEALCLAHADSLGTDIEELLSGFRKLRASLHKTERQGLTQASLDSFFAKS